MSTEMNEFQGTHEVTLVVGERLPERCVLAGEGGTRRYLRRIEEKT
jgi:hypothetical protein